MKKGLVLEGGAMRGLFTSGILDVFMENDIPFDGIVGVSAGAAFGCNYKSNQPGRVIRYNLKYINDPRYFSLRSLIKTGDYFGAEFCFHEIPEKLDVFDAATFESSDMEFFVVCTDVETGKAIYKRIQKVGHEELEWIRASSSMPLAAKIVRIGEHKLMDGGLADSIPLRFFQHMGYDKNVVILTRPEDYVKAPSKTLPIIKKTMKMYPEFIKTVERRPEMYHKQLEYVKMQEQIGSAYVIKPPKALPIGYIDKNPDLIKETYEIGRIVGRKHLENVKEFLEL
ncbi:MAG: patatin family protein [Eubacteriaceae bacterium]|nr:patatin family protein [Eubacteriaceae bacterium]